MTCRFPSPFALLPGALLCASAFVLMPAAARAQQPPALDPAAVLSQLKELKAKQPDMINREKAGVLAAINAAINDPGKAYEQAVMAVDIQGNGPNEGGRVADWRKKNGALLRDHDFLEACRLNLTWLALTWQHSMGMKVADQLPGLFSYTNQISNASDTVLGFDFLTKKPISDGLFATYFQVGPFLTKSENWEEQPLNVEGIYKKTILPQLRASKDLRVLDYWNVRIQAETGKQAATGNGLALSKSKNVKLPGLFWSRAEDEVALGQVNQGVADMMALIKGHPDHPDFDRWVNRVTEIVTPPAGEVTVGPATTP